MAENNYQSEEKIFALMAPHAGYRYAGTIFGSAYSTIKNRPIKTVIIVGNSHHAYFDGISIYSRGAFETPLGKVMIDSKIAGDIITHSKKFTSNTAVHSEEHSIEVHLPFLQTALKKFKIVPILMGNDLMSTCKLLADVLKHIVVGRDDILLVASSDMSHYPPYQEANEVDREVLEMIKKGDARNLENLLHEMEMRGIPGGVSFLCGAGAVKTIMLLAKEVGASQIKILNYANSGDVISDRSGVVGYGAVAFSFPAEKKMLQKESEIIDDIKEGDIAEADKKELLKIAKTSVEAKVKGSKIPEFSPASSVLNETRGAFVTIRRGEALRGCIGRIMTNDPLYKTVQEMAIEAATADPRFLPVGVEELPGLQYEISILSPMEKISDPLKEIELGKHGVQVINGFRAGVFLPQVAGETGWDLETFMNELCEGKAGLPKDAWKTGKADVYRFTAEVVK